MSLEREPGELETERRRLGVHAVSPPDAQCRRVLAGARDERCDELVRLREDHLADGAQLQRKRGVEHVRGGQPEVDPAPGLAGGGGEHVHERRHVVVGDALALVHGLHGERGGANRLQLRRGGTITVPEQTGQLLAGGDLDLPPCLHPRPSVHRAPSSGRV